MIRGSLIVLALASAFALNGCSQCSSPQTETPPAETAAPEAAPAETMTPAPEAAPAVEATPAPAEGGAAATPAEGGHQ